jgi:hypothetical protein
MNDNGKNLLYRFAVIAISLSAWVYMLATKAVDGQLQSVLTLLCGAAAGYHSSHAGDGKSGANNVS